MATSEARTRILLWAGIVAGVVAAAAGLVSEGRSAAPLPADAVASVNGHVVSEEAFAALASALARERRQETLPPELERRVLERLVDEELLLQRGLELGLARHEPTARRAIVSALVATVTADAETGEPDEAELRAFLAAEADRFRRPDRLLLDAVFVSAGAGGDAAARERAEAAARALRAGVPVPEVDRRHGDTPRAPLPGGPLPPEVIRRYLGPTPAAEALRLEPGAVSAPVRGGAGYYVLRLRARQPGVMPRFEEVRDEVRAELLRQRGEQALSEYLDALRESSDVRTRLPRGAEG